MAPNRRPVRLVLAVGVVAGLTNALVFPRLQPAQVGIATDTYYHAAEAALAGGDFYAVAPPDHPGYTFLYPPAVVVAFVPYALLGDPALAYAVQVVLNLGTALALAAVLVATVERAGVALPRLDRVLVAGFACCSVNVVTTVVLGQVNLQLALGIAAGVLLVERGRETVAGVVLAAVAAVKLFPALVGAWLLRRRARRTVLAAAVAGAAVLLAGVALFGPDATLTYLTETLPGEADVGTFEGGPDPGAPYVTIRRQLAVVAPWLPGSWLLPAGALVLSPVVLASYRTVADRRSRLVALQATLLATLVLFPLEPFYLALAVFPLVPLLYLLDPGTPRRLFLAGTVLTSVPVTLETVAVWTGALPAGLSGVALDLARASFAFALPPTYGVWLLLAGCVLYQHRAVADASNRERRDPPDVQNLEHRDSQDDRNPENPGSKGRRPDDPSRPAEE